jgi:subtilase family serine protease
MTRRSFSSRPARRAPLVCEELEPRDVPSASPFQAVPGARLLKPAITNGAITGYTPDQIRTAYGFYGVTDPVTGSAFGTDAAYNADAGRRQTIAIVAITNDPNILSDANFFSSTFHLPQFNTGPAPSHPSLTVVNENGSTTGLPTQVSGSWSGEIAEDVELAHAIAPQADILLVESNSTFLKDLIPAINTARSWPGVTAVSMSWGGSEFPGISSYDKYLTTPAGHPGVTFTAATLDNGAYYHNQFTAAYWPAVSPNALAVGGTTLRLDSQGHVLSETGWAASGGGLSRFESQPAYQRGVVTQSTTQRTNPDVAYNADFATGYAIYDTVPFLGQTGWFDAGGTSAGAPQWAALVALADQLRAAHGLPALDGPSQTLYALYQMAAPATYGTYFNDITTGNNGYPAGPGYDLVTGLGTPRAAAVVQGLAGVQGARSSQARDTLQGIELFPGIISGNTRYGATFIGSAAGNLPGFWEVSVNYNNPPSPGPNVTNHIVGGTWAVVVYSGGSLLGTLFGSVGSGSAQWDSTGTMATITDNNLSIVGGTGAFAGVTGTGTFAGMLSHVPFPPTIGGTLDLSY